jgi:hypothetical protein
MAITGHRTLKEVDRYTRGARQKVLADSAMRKFAAGHSENGIDPPQSAISGGSMRGKKALKISRSIEGWCPGAESNHRHADFQSAALPTELPGPFPANAFRR